MGSDEARAIANMAASENPAAFLYLGDVYEAGTPEEFARNYDAVYGALRAITLPTPGNHDWPNHAVGYDPYWSSVIGGTPAPYYATSVAGWQLISLNSEMDHSETSPQGIWLRKQLKAPGSCRLVFWHRPRFSGATHGDQPDMDPVWKPLRGHAALVLNGHEHDMQQMRPRGGITELIVGAGGRGRYPVDTSYPGLVWSDDSTNGGLRLTLRPGRAQFAYVALGGKTLRSGNVRCRTS
jgi:acid phosphatase type 7